MTKGINPQLFQRQISVTVGSTLISGLDVAFNIKKTLKKEPNTADLKIWDLSSTTRKTIEQSLPSSTTVPVPVLISAGYVGAMASLFSGEIRSASTVQVVENQITELTTGDGDQAIGQSRLTVAFTKGSTAAQGLRAILSAMGVGQGNLASALALLSATPAVAQMFSMGGVFKGSASDTMTDFCRSAGLEWSIQDGALQFLPLGQPLAGQSYLIDSAHGMEGSPTVDTKGVMTVNTRLIPGIKPGVIVVINGKYVQGNYRVAACEYVGSTRSKEWGIKIEGDLF